MAVAAPEGSYCKTVAGYLRVKVSGYPRSDRGWVLEHRHVMEGALGRALRSDEVVHHRNGDRTDNRLANLLLVTVNSHGEQHRVFPRPTLTCKNCGKVFIVTGNQASAVRSLRRRGVETRNAYCSARCRNAGTLPALQAANGAQKRWANHIRQPCSDCGRYPAHGRGFCRRCYGRRWREGRLRD
jgi:hypothetical protein